jgi:site-specific recombinase XerD
MKLKDAADLYISRRRAGGEKMQAPAAMLRSFCGRYGHRALRSITAADVKAFLDGPLTGPATWRQKYGMLRVFFEHWRRRGELRIPPMPIAAPRYTSSFVPYIYSRQELKALLDVVPVCQRNTMCILSAETFRVLLLLLYGTGLRVGEALRLRMMDVDLDSGAITIRGTKFHKSRLVPLGRDVHRVLLRYAASPGRRKGSEQALFQSRLHKEVKWQVVQKSFQRLRRTAGISRPDAYPYQPRIHDLRHTFAVHRVLSWYQQGDDVQSLLPALSTYLGHVDLSSTQRYLTMTPKLLNEANLRFQHYVYGGGNAE